MIAILSKFLGRYHQEYLRKTILTRTIHFGFICSKDFLPIAELDSTYLQIRQRALLPPLPVKSDPKSPSAIYSKGDSL